MGERLESGASSTMPAPVMQEIRTRPSAGASWLSAVFLVGPLSAFAELLIVKTHHRSLAAVTFACVAVLAWIVVELISRRALDPRVSEQTLVARRVAWGVSALSSAGLVLRSLL